MKKFQKMMHVVAIVNFVMWIVLGCVFTFDALCGTHFVYPGYEGFITDLKEFAPDTLKAAVVVYQPLCWMIDASRATFLGFAVTGLLGLAVAYLLFKRISNKSDNFTWHDGVKYSIDIVSNLYLIGFFAVIIYGILRWVILF